MWRSKISLRTRRKPCVRLFSTEVDKPDKPATSLTTKILAATGAITSLYVGWHFHQAGYSIKQTEVRLLERFRRLPLYPPPGPPASELNVAIDCGALEKETCDILAKYFILFDAKTEGITRDDVVVLIDEELHLGKEEEKNIIGKFVSRGKGENRELKRRCQLGLPEFLKFIDELIAFRAEEDKISRADIEAKVREKMQNQLPATLSFTTPLNVNNLSLRSTMPVAASQQVSPAEDSGYPVPVEDMFSEEDDNALLMLEHARLRKDEQLLLDRRERLTPAEESRLNEIQQSIRSLEEML